MPHFHLTDGAVEAPRVRATDKREWLRYRPGDTRFGLAPCESPTLTGRWAGLCQKNARRFGWYPGAATTEVSE